MYRQFLRPLPLLLLVLLIGLASYSIKSQRETRALQQQLSELQSKNPSANQEEVKQVIAEVSKVYELPVDETPTLATISDKEKLQDVPFFAKAENGDKVLIYVNARKALLYRPTTHKLVDVAAVNLQPRVEADESVTAKIAIRNASTTTGLAKRFEDILKRLFPKAQFVGVDQAKQSVATTIVVDQSGSHQEAAAKVAKLLGATVGALPAGENPADGADILIMLGNDKATTPMASPSSSPKATTTPKPSVSPTTSPTT
jgi:hypothetical protein